MANNQDAKQETTESLADPNSLHGQRVLVMGLGLLGGGVAAARYAVEQSAREVVVTDLRPESVLQPSIQKLAGLPIRYVLGHHTSSDFEHADVVVRNPGVRLDSPFLTVARAAGARIEMEIAWFFRAWKGRIAGITGTRGKSTTTMLLYATMQEAGMEPLLGGNLGGIETLSLLSQMAPDRWVVLELGNWMLEGLHPIHRSPHLAIFTNLLPDHLNSYSSMEDYGEAKSSIFRYQGPGDTAIFNWENAYTRAYAETAPAEHVWLYAPQSSTATPRGLSSDERLFLYRDDIKLRGDHNLGNVQAATLAAELLGIGPHIIRRAVSGFTGIPHRLEAVRETGGILYVNDSASTAPIAGVAALRSFTQPIVLIAGGNSKNLDPQEFAAEIAVRVKHVVLLAGDASLDLASAIRTAARAQGNSALATAPLAPSASLEAALEEARSAAAPGDVVLLSPGFTSFGLFLNEFDRGNQFKELVRGL
ncbi:MAG: UDP-N-acetylmuramoyl-L-alanine--D-glutamate ligase [Ktedonobacterales bacterium]